MRIEEKAGWLGFFLFLSGGANFAAFMNLAYGAKTGGGVVFVVLLAAMALAAVALLFRITYLKGASRR